MSDNSTTRARIKFSRIKRRVLKHVWLVRTGVLFLILTFLALLTFASVKLSEKIGIGNYLMLAANFISAPKEKVASIQDRTNILIMGRSGGSHDGPDLTDTMVLVSISLTKPRITVISIPRDLWIPEIRSKINSAYYWGDKSTAYFDNSGNTGGKIAFVKAITSEVVGEPIQYGVVIDFSAFKDLVDALGGIQVNIERSFTDSQYPIAGKEDDTCGGDPTLACRYQTVTFNAGTQVMNGDTALIFVRSRHAFGDEGTDIAREARQQKVIDAIKDKIMNPKILLSPRVGLAMLNILKKYVQTDIDGPVAAILARFGLRGIKTINQYLIPSDLLVTPPISAKYDFQSVFVPKAGSGNWEDINKWFAGVLP